VRRFASWPEWALVLLRRALEWSDLLPMVLLEVYVELAQREPDHGDLVGVWCPGAAGVA
jgi:hypothetical protein